MKSSIRKSSAQGVRRHLPGGMPVNEFLRDYWQKRPLLVRNAMPGFGAALDQAGLLKLAARDDVESRFVAHDTNHWDVAYGPILAKRWARLKGPWTVLVQGVNQYLAAGDELLHEFNFIPHARLDDLMVSFATDKGGVGPHIDNYDVFLIQGCGQRRWRIGEPRDRRLIDGAPLRILRHFEPDEDLVLNPGDMLYLPPDWAHDGIAIGNCMTWSVGFRTSPAEELVDQFLMHLQEELRDSGRLDGRYADPDLSLQAHPGEIGQPMVSKVMRMLEAIRWDEKTVRRFLGCMLSEPKANVVFDGPQRPLSLPRFALAAARHGVKLDLQSRMLFAKQQFFINGEICPVPATCRPAFRQLADGRSLAATEFTACPELAAVLHQSYLAGYLHLAN